MINRKFRPVGWCAAVAVAALGCYLISHRVAAERNDLADVEREIAEARRDILSLGTELETRARMSQLESWNDEVFALAAPGAGQFLEGGFDLAALYGIDQPMPGAPAELRQASATVAATRPAMVTEAVIVNPPDAPRKAPLVVGQTAYVAPVQTALPVAVREAAYAAPVELAPPPRVVHVAFLDGVRGEIAEQAEREGASGE